MALDLQIPFLGSIPIDPRIGMSCDYGKSFTLEFPDSPAALAYNEIVDNLKLQLI
jgi:MinD-like ATPase involved in chromosome partitioning or flagellar assembly